MGIIYRGTIAWAYVFSFPAGVIWGKIRNKEITPEKKKLSAYFLLPLVHWS